MDIRIKKTREWVKKNDEELHAWLTHHHNKHVNGYNSVLTRIYNQGVDTYIDGYDEPISSDDLEDFDILDIANWIGLYDTIQLYIQEQVAIYVSMYNDNELEFLQRIGFEFSPDRNKLVLEGELEWL